MTNAPASKSTDFLTPPRFDGLSDDLGLELLDPLDDFADPDVEEIVGTAHRVAAGESFD